MSLGVKLKKLRQEKGINEGRKISGNKAADEIGISYSYYNRLENDNKDNPSPEYIEKISRYYNVSVGYLLNNKNDYRELLPPEIKMFLENDSKKYLKIAQRAYERNVDPEIAIQLIEIIAKQKAKST